MEGKRIALIATGGNVDRDVFAKVSLGRIEQHRQWCRSIISCGSDVHSSATGQNLAKYQIISSAILQALEEH